ncbi:sphingomyelin phosphodiesterase-like [Liolophura sinensis]|uniref:sphingomyelin phosphodiesterase-like n=1 Tax=Liolophura sinensis TaxID=3198878 RepID=UPI0031598A64
MSCQDQPNGTTALLSYSLQIQIAATTSTFCSGILQNARVTAVTPGAPKIRILQITDIHLDLEYGEGLNTNCGEPICCRTGNGPPKPGDTGAGRWGDYRSCDLPLRTLENMLQYLSTIQDQFDLVYWTGDLPAHNVWNQTRADQLHLLDLFTKMYRQYLPHKPLFPCVGNHESAPVNSYPPPFITGDNSIQWLYERFVSSWGLPSSTAQDVLRGGYYTVSPYPGLRVVSLNNNYCNNMNWWVLLNTTDPAGELSWLVDVLTRAERNHEKVHILSHIPTGSGDCLQAWSWSYYDIINRFESTVTAQFFGHSHSDHYAIFYDSVNFTRPVSILYIGGAVTPQNDMNPGFRIYTADGNYSGSSWQMLDHTNYILNLTEANNGGAVRWQKEYSAKVT